MQQIVRHLMLPFLFLFVNPSKVMVGIPSDILEHKASLQFAKIEGHDMAYVDEGEGEVILLVHGIPTSSWMYRKMVSPLVKEGYRVIVPDMLGFGFSDKPRDLEQYSNEKHSHRLSGLMKHLEIEEWNQVVHDAGGLWSWNLIIADDEKIKNLVILNTILFEEGFEPPVNMNKGSFALKTMSKMYQWKLTGKPMVKMTLKNGTTEKNMTKEDKKGYWYPIRTGSSTALRYFFGDFPNFQPLLEKVQTHLVSSSPDIYVIWGAKDDILIGDKQIPLIKEKLGVNESNVVILENATHFLPEEQPLEVADHIVKFLKSK